MRNDNKSFSLIDRWKSIVIGAKGILNFFRSEHNAIVHLSVSIVVVAFGIWLSISKSEWIMITFAIGLVFSAEIFNTAIEKLADQITLEYNEHVKKIKDLAAAAVLVCAITAVIIGLIIFLPLLIQKFS